ncbi:MAG: glycosyltransferase [Clostridiaceae bacterium]
MKKSILFVIHQIRYGGADKMLSYVANQLSKGDYDVHIYTYEGTTSYYELDNYIDYIPEKNIATKRILRRFIQIYQVKKIINRVKPDVVISFLQNPNTISTLATLFTKVPVIICERGDPYRYGIQTSKFLKFIYYFAQGSVFQTEGARDYFNKKIVRNSEVIPNPVTQKSKYDSDIKRNNEIVFVGRFELIQKRQDVMLKAFAKVTTEYPEIKLVFYGDGKDLETIQNMSVDLGVEDKVQFAGVVNNICDTIKSSKMFVLTSDYEGIPNALIEAMSVGLPVISTDCSPGGARMLIENKVNGVIVSKGDVDAVVKAIKNYIEHPDLAEQYAKIATEIVDKYSPKKIINMWSKYIDKIIGESYVD